MSKAIILDTETTGSKPPMNVIELAYIGINEDFMCDEIFTSMYKPELPIAFGAKAAHHILEADVAEAPDFSTFELPTDVEYIIGHKVNFDIDAIGFGESEDIKRICTLAIARKHFPELDAHTQSAMIYYFFPEAEAREMVKNAHRAFDDVRNCRELLIKLREVILAKGIPFSTFEEMWVESERCRIPDTISFGKHVGSRIEDLPLDYKRWILRQPDMDEYLKIAVRQTMAGRQASGWPS